MGRCVLSYSLEACAPAPHGTRKMMLDGFYPWSSTDLVVRHVLYWHREPATDLHWNHWLAKPCKWPPLLYDEGDMRLTVGARGAMSFGV